MYLFASTLSGDNAIVSWHSVLVRSRLQQYSRSLSAQVEEVVLIANYVNSLACVFFHSKAGSGFLSLATESLRLFCLGELR